MKKPNVKPKQTTVNEFNGRFWAT